jgi:hypothetical protein
MCDTGVLTQDRNSCNYEESHEMREIRRVVVGTDADGQSHIQFDSPAPIRKVLGKTGGAGSLWTTREMPVKNVGYVDRALAPFHPMPEPHGTVFSFLAIPPESELDRQTLAQTIETLRPPDSANFSPDSLR